MSWERVLAFSLIASFLMFGIHYWELYDQIHWRRAVRSYKRGDLKAAKSHLAIWMGSHQTPQAHRLMSQILWCMGGCHRRSGPGSPRRKAMCEQAREHRLLARRQSVQFQAPSSLMESLKLSRGCPTTAYTSWRKP